MKKGDQDEIYLRQLQLIFHVSVLCRRPTFTGWLLCDGSEYIIAEYPQLDAIGYTFKDIPTGKFAVTILRGRSLGLDNMNGVVQIELLVTVGLIRICGTETKTPPQKHNETMSFGEQFFAVREINTGDTKIMELKINF